MNVWTRHAGAACLTLLMVACGVPQAAPDRCLEDVNLAELIEAEGLPQVQSQGWGASSVAGIRKTASLTQSRKPSWSSMIQVHS